MYCVGKVYEKTDKTLLTWCGDNSGLAVRLYNASLFRLRNYFTGRKKERLTPNEQQVFDEVSRTAAAYSMKMPKSVLAYNFLEKLMRVTENPDFFAGLPMQTAQAVVKSAVQDFKNWLAALRTYKQSPSAFTGKPKMPGYCRSGHKTFTMTNQDCVIKKDDRSFFIKLPKTDCVVRIETLPDDAVLKEVKVKPYYEGFMIYYTYDTNFSDVPMGLTACAAIDFGVDNLAAIVTGNGKSLLVKGGAVKAQSQWFNKQRAHYTSILTKGTKKKSASSHMLTSLSRNRAFFLSDMFHQVSRRIVDWCVQNKVGTLYLGSNKYWKQNINIGHVNNQTFASIPFDILKNMIKYKAEQLGIRVFDQEESYTSKASFLDNDVIPTYGQNDKDAQFSGKRIKRGLYRSSDGTVINADLNGAANILRKAGQIAAVSVKCLQEPEVLYYTDLHKSNSVKGIVAA